MVSKREILEHYERRKMLRSILEILQRFHDQNHNWNQGKFNESFFYTFPKKNYLTPIKA